MPKMQQDQQSTNDTLIVIHDDDKYQSMQPTVTDDSPVSGGVIAGPHQTHAAQMMPAALNSDAATTLQYTTSRTGSRQREEVGEQQGRRERIA